MRASSETALRPVSPRLITARRIAALPGQAVALLLIAAAVTAAVLLDRWWLALLALIPLAVVLPGVLLVGRRVRALGYAERDDDLVVATGVLVRRVVTVPYGRIQSVTLSRGPLLQRLGLADVQLTTAAAAASVVIPGLDRAEAEALRLRLLERGEAQLAAL
ncbi:PH domain-containing protein [Brachybacterium sp. EF45031]|uniref:PH domain-containing protein n=1 Tax=Brachybacterium sillae TaxID=2810536 RepID=UPI00217D8A34|nr:PH domain-containing protein [Brachybacterium sillae]MCS6712600.1 PH domain-containing protein [Brachybacterium sillae]